MRRIIAAVTSSITRPAVKTGAVNCFLGNRFEDQGPIDHRLGARHAWSAVAFAPTRRRHVAAVVEFRRQPPRRCDGPVMAIVPHSVWLAGFTALMLAAAIVDLRRLVIPSPLSADCACCGSLNLKPAATISAALATVGCAAAVFAGGAVLFSRGLIGGGDVKLLAVASLSAGADAVPPLLVMTALIGGLRPVPADPARRADRLPAHRRRADRQPRQWRAPGAGPLRRGDRRRGAGRNPPTAF